MRWKPVRKLKPSQDGQCLLTTDGHTIKLCCVIQGMLHSWEDGSARPNWHPTHWASIRLPSRSEKGHIDHTTPILAYLRALHPAGASSSMIGKAIGFGNPKRTLQALKKDGLVESSMSLDAAGVPYRRWVATSVKI